MLSLREQASKHTMLKPIAMKNPIHNSARFISAAFCLLLFLLADYARAATPPYFWDPEGVWSIPPAYTGSLSGTWETANWSTLSGGQSSRVAWIETGVPACFAVGSGSGTPPFTMTMNSDHTVGGVIAGGRTVPLSCNVTINGPGSMILPANTLQVFRVANSSDGSQGLLTLNNVVAGANAGMAVVGDGKLFLNAANTFSGGLFLGAPGVVGASTNIVSFNNAGAFGTGSITISNTTGAMATLAIAGGSALNITNAVSVPASTANSLNITGNPAGLTFSGPWNLASTISVGSDGAANLVIVSGVMSGAGGFNKFSPGTMQLTATNTYTGNTTVSNGVLQLGDGVSRNGNLGGTIGVWSPGSLVFANPTALTFSRIISGTGPVTCQGAGVLTLSAANIYGGTTTINAGSNVKLGVANAFPFGAGSGDVSLAGTLDLANFACSVNGLNGAGTVDNSTGTGTYTLSAGNNNANSTFSGIIQNTSGTIALTKAGTGTLTLSGANTYAGQTTLSGGTLRLGADNVLPSSSLLLTSAGTTLDMNGHNDTLPYLSGPGSIINNNATLTVNGNLNGASSQNFNGYSCLAGPLSGSGTLAKAGTGAMAMRADSSSYAGTVSLTGGTLSVGAAPNRLPTSLALSIPSGATFQLDANNQTLSALSGSGNVNLGGGKLSVNQSGSGSFDGVIRNSDMVGSSTSLGHGLRGYYYANIDFTQLNTVRDDSTVNFPDETTFPFYSGSSKTNQISTRWVGQVLTTVAGAYVFTVKSDDGARLWVNGVLMVDSWILQGSTAHSGTNTLASNTRYDIVLEWFNNAGPGAAQLYWTPPGDSTAVIIPSNNLFLPGPGSLVKAGNGVLQLTAANSYSGGTTVSGGTLDATVDGALGVGNATVGAGANLQLDSSAGIDSGADLILAASAHNVNLNYFGSDNIRALSLDGGVTYQPAGSYGSASSGAPNVLAVLSGSGVLNVQANPTGTTLTSSPSSPATVGYGSTVTLTAHLSGSGSLNGTVSFFDGTNILGTSTVSSGVASLSVSNLMVITSPHSITAVYSGDSTDARSTSNPVTVNTTTATITPFPVIATKFYDGTTSATIGSATFSGILPDDTNYVHIATTGYTATYSDPFVGTNKSVNITGMTLSGSLSGNYALSTSSAVTTGSITNRTATVSGLIVTTKLYDSTTSATVTGTPALNNVLGGDTVTLSGSPTVAFTTKAAGTGKPVTLTGYTIGGSSATNYILVLTNLTGTITATNIAVLGLSGGTKTYDGTTTAPLVGSPTAQFYAGDSVSLIGTPTATFVSAGAGVGIPITVTGFSLIGADASDYALSQPSGISGTISPAATTATITSSLNPSTNGNSVTFTYNVTSTTSVPAPPTGSVTFYTNNIAVSPAVTLVASTTTNATASFTTSLLPVGTTPVKGVYGGDSNFSAPNVPTVNQTVNGTGVCSHTNRVLSVTALGGGSFNLNLIGTYQAQYRILFQTNAAQPMANWAPVYGGTNTVANANGLWSVTVTNRAPAFFRAQAMSGVCP
jgi:fibronectin-binding autotransporter adhesin